MCKFTGVSELPSLDVHGDAPVSLDKDVTIQKDSDGFINMDFGLVIVGIKNRKIGFCGNLF